MTENEYHKETLWVGLSADAVAYRACVLDIRGKSVSILKNYAVPTDEMDWDCFVKTIKLDFPDRNFVTAMDFDDGCVGFYHFDIPAVNEKQMPPVIASQAEIHFPLPIEQMQYHWKVLGQKDGKVDVSVAAAREAMLTEAVVRAKQTQVDAVVLRSEAVIKAVRCLCDDLTEDFSLLYLGRDEPKLMFVQNGMLARVTTLDCQCRLLTEKQSSQALLLAMDIQNVIAENPACDSTLLLLESGGTSCGPVVRAVLQDKGIETGQIELDVGRLAGGRNAEIQLETLGAALIAAEPDGWYDLLRELYTKTCDEVKENRGTKAKVLAGVVCLLLVIFIAVGYGADKLLLATYEKKMDTPEFVQLQKMHQLRNTIAQQRIDIPDLIAKVNESLPKGVTVQSLSARRNQQIAVTASCKDPKVMYGFVEALGKCRGVETVRISSQSVDEKKKQTVFTLTFDYKNFTKKSKVSR